ncbi:MAG TPA: DUF6600 domain-containing protein [Verrucomicrobiae bacterium]
MILAALIPLTTPAQDASSDQAAPADASSMQTELPSDVDPNSPLAQIVHLAQSGVDESVLISYAGNSPTPFSLTADQIIYLKDIGVPDTVVQAMIQRDQQLGATDTTTTTAAQPAPNTAPPTGDVTSDYFYGALAPYGGWVNINGYGLCWRPSALTYDSGWQPYCDHGHWIYTDDGWYWTSDYSWGWATFHYGRWFHDTRWGWCWWPDTDWAPSWVCWRHSDSYCGWAPLPPHSVYRSGVGFVYNGITVGANFDFGISANFFTFVPAGNFCDPHPRRFRVDAGHAPAVYHQTTVINNFDFHNNVFVNHGIDPQRITAVTHVPIHTVAIRESSSPISRGEAVGRNQTLVINRPHFTGTAVTTMHQGVAPHETSGQNGSHAWYTTQPQQNNQHTVVNQPNRAAPSPPVVNQNAGHQQQNNNYKPPQTTHPVNTWTAPRQTYQPAPSQPQDNHNQQVETPQRTPSVNEPAHTAPEQPAQSGSPYRENQEPAPQYNNNGASQRYSSPRSQEQMPRESSPPVESHTAPAPQQQQRQQQGQKQQQDQQQGQQQGQGRGH